jgi:hypothetical protein
MVKKTTKKIAQKVTKNKLSSWFPAPRKASTMNDIKTAILIVSLAINVAIFIGWLALRVTTSYDQQVFNFLFVR